MICREYVCNFLQIFLHSKLFTYWHSFITTIVNYFSLIMNI